jgi:hypothetical protein
MLVRRAVVLALAMSLATLPALAQGAYPPPGYPPPPPGYALPPGYPPPPPPPPGYPPPPPAVPLYPPAQLDQMLAPIALYPDPLLTQLLTAAAYPGDVDEAARWLALPQNAGLRGPELTEVLEQYNWDPSVKSLVPFPHMLEMMDEHLDWTEALGNAMAYQQGDVMESVQRLRREALNAGTLVSNPYETVEVSGPYVAIEPAQPQYVYVPVYHPGRVYGAWPYPSYPPYDWEPPPGLEARFSVGVLGFAIGIPVVAALWDWSHPDWRRHEVHVDPDRFNRINAGRPPIRTTNWEPNREHRERSEEALHRRPEARPQPHEAAPAATQPGAPARAELEQRPGGPGPKERPGTAPPQAPPQPSAALPPHPSAPGPQERPAAAPVQPRPVPPPQPGATARTEAPPRPSGPTPEVRPAAPPPKHAVPPPPATQDAVTPPPSRAHAPPPPQHAVTPPATQHAATPPPPPSQAHAPPPPAKHAPPPKPGETDKKKPEDHQD